MQKNVQRSSGPMKYSIMLAFLLGATLLWVKQVENSQRKAQDQQIIASYDQDAVDGKVPMPVKPDAITVVRKGGNGDPTMVIIKNMSGENRVFRLIPPDGSSSTNWHFRAVEKTLNK